MTTEIVKQETRDRILRAPIGLLVATGALVPTKDGKSTRPAQLGHFRFKEGALEQYADAAAKAAEVYGDEPTSLDDVYLLSNEIGDVLDIRIKAWGKSGLRIVGKTNFAELDPDEYAARVDAWDDDILYRPREAKEVPPRLRAEWKGEAIPGKLEGPGDPRIGKFEMRVEATFRFCLPQVFGMGPVALYASASKHNRDQIYKGVTDAAQWLQGNLIGIPFRFRIRPRKTSYFDSEKRAYLPTQTFEVVFDTPWTMQQAIDAVREQREALGAGPAGSERLALPAADSAFFNGTAARARDEEEERILAAARELPQPTDEDVRTRDEPSAIQRVDDAQLNRLANLAGQFDGDLSIYLRGAFAVDSLEELTPDQAVQAELALERLTGAEHIEEGEYELPDADPGNEIDF